MTNMKRASSPTLVGRREELARLEALLDGVRSGSSATALIAGEAGIGKTRLVDELAQRAAALDAVVLKGGCIDLGEEVLPYAPFVEMLNDVLRRRGLAEVLELAGSTGDELGRLAPALAVGATPPGYTRASAGRLYQALTALIEGLARRRPVVLIVEDLHWSDRSTRDLLLLLVRQLRGRVLLVFSHRTDEFSDDPALRRFLSELGRSCSQHVVVQPLQREDQARQISGILGRPPSTSLMDQIYARAEGNPFFAEELVALGDGSDVPPTVRDLLLARLGVLPAQTRAVLRAAAAAGRTVTHDLLAAVSDLDGPQLDDALRPAAEAHVLVADPDDRGGYLFRHALLREAIAQTILPGEALRLHRRIAECLTADPSLAGVAGVQIAGRIARHWHAAGDDAATLRSSVTAGDEAAAALAFNEALAHYERAIALLDTVPDTDSLLEGPRYILLWMAAEAAHLAAHPERAAELIRQAIAVADRDHPHHYAYLHERLGRYLWMAADGQGAMQAYQRAFELDTVDVSCWRAALLSGYSQMLILAGRFSESRPWCEEAIAIAQQVDDARGTEGHARNNLGVNLAALGDVDGGIAQLELARRIAEEEFEDVDDIARAIVNLHSVLSDAGRYEQAAQVALDGIAVADQLGLQRRKGVWCRCDAAESLATVGRVDQAAAVVAEARSFTPEGVDLLRTDVVEGLVLLRSGAPADALGPLRSAHAGAQRLVDTWLLGSLYATLVEALVSTGAFDEALRLAAEGAARMAEDEDAANCVELYAAGVAAAVRFDDERGGMLARQWLAAAEQAVARDPAQKAPPRALLLTMRAEVARVSGEPTAAAWAEAAAAWEQLGERYRAAYARSREGAVALANGERPAATAALRLAHSLAADAGARHLLAEIEALGRRGRLRLRTGSAAPAAEAADDYQLTRREREVLALVAVGHTDRQIGEQLFISHRTAERHVANILAKFGAATRAEVVAVAHRSGLVGA